MNTEIFMKKLLTNFMMENFELEEDELANVKAGDVEGLTKIALNFLKL